MTSDGRSSRAGLRILVVEDEYLLAEHIATTLEDLGHVVVGPVSEIDEALALIGSEQLDCVLLDVNLRGTSSAPIATELVAHSMPFIVVTGYGKLSLESAELENAPRITKPFSASDFAATLAEAFDR